MRLNRYDAAATAAVLAAGAVYAAHLASVSFLSGVRVTAGLVLVLGLVACGTNASRPGGVPTAGTYGRIASAFGMLAMGAGLLALTLGAGWALAVLVGVTVLMWVVATGRQACTPAPPPPAAATTRPRELVRR